MKTLCTTSNHRSQPQIFIGLYFSITIVILSMMSGCATFNGTKFESLLGTRANLIKLGYTIAENLEKQAYPPLTPRNPDQPILMTTFVNNSNLNETSSFSMILQEHITSRFVQMGYTVREIKLKKSLQIDPGLGEKMLSRNLRDLEPSQQAQAISVGTYSLTANKIYVTARLINPDNANIISSNDYSFAMNAEMMAMFGIQPVTTEPMDPVAEPPKSILTQLLYW